VSEGLSAKFRSDLAVRIHASLTAAPTDGSVDRGARRRVFTQTEGVEQLVNDQQLAVATLEREALSEAIHADVHDPASRRCECGCRLVGVATALVACNEIEAGEVVGWRLSR